MSALQPLFYQLVTTSLRLIAEVLGLGLVRSERRDQWRQETSHERAYDLGHDVEDPARHREVAGDDEPYGDAGVQTASRDGPHGIDEDHEREGNAEEAPTEERGQRQEEGADQLGHDGLPGRAVGGLSCHYPLCHSWATVVALAKRVRLWHEQLRA